jgi:hypothetical protein
MYSILLTPQIVKNFTKFSDQGERVVSLRAVARIGWLPCRHGQRCVTSSHSLPYGRYDAVKESGADVLQAGIASERDESAARNGFGSAKNRRSVPG